ncbi:molybdenum cofactor guanylyltransferase [Rathayibacter sp. KR2-224]|uniref:molybdenum cofactor guanylyltransferase n=1 Tax=Rathayibacter sp. KR2-224 TaxID=3400913 RepID=UPI003C010913
MSTQALRTGRPIDELAAVVLAGGRASRLGGIDKPALVVDGTSLLDHAIAASHRAGARAVVVVGPHETAHRAAGTDALTPDVRFTREKPPFGGPLAALAAGLELVDAALVLVLAADLPFAERVGELLHARVGMLADARDEPVDGVVLVDGDGRDQWLAGVYRTSALRAAIQSMGRPVEAAPLRVPLGTLRLIRIDGSDAVFDIDTWADAELVRATVDGAATTGRRTERDEQERP